MGQIRSSMLKDLQEGSNSLEKKELYEAAANAVLDGTAQARYSTQSGYKEVKPWILYLKDRDTEVFENYVLAYYLWKLDNTEFTYEKAYSFAEKMRELFGYSAKGWGTPLLNVLREWVDCNLKYPYFDKVKDPKYNRHYERYEKDENPNKRPLLDSYYSWPLKEGEPRNPIHEDIFKFACYVAVCLMKYGPDFYSITANEIFETVTKLGSNLPAKMKKHGSGDMPKELLEYKDNTLSCKANDAFATIKITMKEESEANYEKVLDFLCTLLSADFPRSYSLDFQSSKKNYLPIKKLPKKGVNQLFANAVQYPELHKKIEQYARLAIKEFEWYTNLESENCAMPGTFAVFALGLLGDAYLPLVFDYMQVVDDEHQLAHGEFVLAYIEKYGFTGKGLELYQLCENNIQYLPSKLTALHKKAKLS